MLMMNHRYLCLGLPTLLIAIFGYLYCTPIQAQFDPQRVFPQNDLVKARYPDPDITYTTPGFRPGRIDFTSHTEMLTFIETLQKQTPVVGIRFIGHSQEGRQIPALVLTTLAHKDASELQKSGRPIVIIAGLQHGNEPAGGEAMLVLAQALATGHLRPLLERLTVIIVPHSNPDGAYYFRRSPYSTIDMNRDHVKVDLPETRALHQLVNDYQPHVFIDAHEFSVATRWVEKFGVIQSYDLMLQYATHPNVDPALTTLADQTFLPALRQDIDRAGYKPFWYYTTSYNLSNRLVAMGGTIPDIGRNFAGLQHAVSFLVESRGVGIGRDSFKRRVHSHMIAITSLLQTAADHAPLLMTTVATARASVIARGLIPQPHDTIAVTLNSPVVKQNLTMLEPSSGELKQIEVDWSDSLAATPALSRQRPYAYIMPPVFHDVAQRLQQSGVQVMRLARPTTLPVESYRVTDRKTSGTYIEGRLTSQVTTETVQKQVQFPAGSYVYMMGQVNANVLGVALEPESPSSFVTFGWIPVDKQGSPATIAASSEIPIYRLLKSMTLDVQTLRDYKFAQPD